MSSYENFLHQKSLTSEEFINGRWQRLSTVNRPFGFIMSNGMNFAKSIHNSNSVLCRILQVVDNSLVVLTKKEILTKLGYKLDMNPRLVNYGDGIVVKSTDHATRGYLSWYFSGMHKAGFLVPVRQLGNRVVWVKGKNFPNLSQLIDVRK